MRLEAQTVFGGTFGSETPLPVFASANATLRERSDIGCLLLSAAVDSADIIAAAGEAVGVELPSVAGEFRTKGKRLALMLSPRSWIVQCGVDEETALVDWVNATFADKTVNAARFTDYLCWFELSGSDGTSLLKEGGFLSLERGGFPVGHAKRTLIAKVTAIVIRPDEQIWLVGIERSRARYFADWLASCACLARAG